MIGRTRDLRHGPDDAASPSQRAQRATPRPQCPGTARTASLWKAPLTTSRTGAGLAARYNEHAAATEGGEVLASILPWLVMTYEKR